MAAVRAAVLLGTREKSMTAQKWRIDELQLALVKILT
jgi:hypothetical protein